MITKHFMGNGIDAHIRAMDEMGLREWKRYDTPRTGWKIRAYSFHFVCRLCNGQYALGHAWDCDGYESAIDIDDSEAIEAISIDFAFVHLRRRLAEKTIRMIDEGVFSGDCIELRENCLKTIKQMATEMVAAN